MLAIQLELLKIFNISLLNRNNKRSVKRKEKKKGLIRDIFYIKNFKKIILCLQLLIKIDTCCLLLILILEEPSGGLRNLVQPGFLSPITIFPQSNHGSTLGFPFLSSGLNLAGLSFSTGQPGLKSPPLEGSQVYVNVIYIHTHIINK